MGGPVTARMEQDLPDVVRLTRRRWRRRGRQSCWRRRHRQRPLPPLGLKSIRWIFSQTVGRFDSIAGIQLDKRNSVALEMYGRMATKQQPDLNLVFKKAEQSIINDKTFGKIIHRDGGTLVL
ncbi:hypothetical protein K1719_045169 [Acacia pycnantha]|nr:hypothetical protein K1719_045169 [Acacia pycnantha]